MPSPFPGMNPYLESPSVWRDFHQTFLVAFREQLAAAVTPRYFVQLDEHVYVQDEDDPDDESLYFADVSVVRPVTPVAGRRRRATTTATAPVPVRLPRFRSRRRVPFLIVHDRESRAVVTVIELLSPTNKTPGPHRETFLEKRRHLVASDANYVEFDLLRGGDRMPVHDLPDCDYYALVSRSNERPKADSWPLGLRDGLPNVPIPLRSGESEPVIDLMRVLHRAYDSARYRLHIYRHDPDPPLAPEDAAWAASLVPPAA